MIVKNDVFSDWFVETSGLKVYLAPSSVQLGKMFLLQSASTRLHCLHSIKIRLHSCLCVVTEPTASPPALRRPELWTSLAFLLVVITAGVCIGVLFSRFRRRRCRLVNMDDRDVAPLKFPKDDDPTLGVRAHQDSA